MNHDLPEPAHQQLPVLPMHRAYVCPGEDHPIPRSIHLARLAAYFPKCRECVHRHDTGQLSRATVGRLEQTAVRVVQPSPFRAEGVRGEYLNHLTRQASGRVAAAVADRLWEAQPLSGRLLRSEDETDEAPARPVHTGPVVVLGHDARPSSPDLCVGVSTALRRMGCEVIDIGRVTAPCHAFAVEHLQADAGLFVTGSGCAPQWTGLDFCGPRGMPWSLGVRNPVSGLKQDTVSHAALTDGSRRTTSSRNRVSEHNTLRDIERRFLAGVSRPTRHGGTQRYFDAAVPYRANLLKHFRDLRPLRIAAATADPVLLQTLCSVFEPLPCDLIPIADPAVAIDPLSPSDRLTKQIRPIIRDAEAACGIAIAEDGQGMCLFDERGRAVSSGTVMAGLAMRLCGHRTLTVAVRGECVDTEATRGISIDAVAGGREALVTRLFDPAVGLGLEPGVRCWIKDTVPTCDAVLTIGLLLRTLSSEEMPLSTLFSTG